MSNITRICESCAKKDKLLEEAKDLVKWVNSWVSTPSSVNEALEELVEKLEKELCQKKES